MSLNTSLKPLPTVSSHTKICLSCAEAACSIDAAFRPESTIGNVTLAPSSPFHAQPANHISAIWIVTCRN